MKLSTYNTNNLIIYFLQKTSSTMKKSTFKALAFFCCATLATPVFAQTDSDDEPVDLSSPYYDFSGFNDGTILELFYQAEQQGRKYPTIEEFKAKGIQPSDLAFVRSHVRKASLLDDADRVNQNTTAGRDLWMNTPLGTSKGVGGYPSGEFNNDVFSMWQYTNLWGSWNHGVFQAPGCNIDAAHRNGTDIFSGIKFFEGWTAGGGDADYSRLITLKNEDGSFKYVKAFINALMFFGSDGVNYNWEDNSWNNEDITEFHRALYREAAAQGFNNFHAGIYTANNFLAAGNAYALYGDKEGRTFDLMLNYSEGDFAARTIKTSVDAAKEAMGSTEGLYTGVWIVGMSNRSWNCLTENPEINVCLWGEHAQSRFFSNSTGADAYARQLDYQRLLETGFSGTNHNPANLVPYGTFKDWDDKLEGFAGLATWIPERSAIQGDLHFLTHFTLGNGDRYYYKGKKALAGGWYNMGAQDIVPTYRWLVYNAGTESVSEDIAPDYCFTDAYTGGTSLLLNGKATVSGTDVVLYKTALKNTGDKTFASIALKTLKEGQVPSNLYILLRVNGQWKEYAVGDVAGGSWAEKQIELPGIGTGDIVERIGLRVKGDDANYNMLVGKLEVNSNAYTKPANVKDLVVEVKSETKTSMAAKLYWDVDAQAVDRKDWGLLYNDEANIHHFEVLYKVGETGKVAEIARTSSWSALVPEINFADATDEPYIGVRAVGNDFQTYSPVLWVKVARGDQSSLPDKKKEDSYGESVLDLETDGVENALNQRYLTSVTTTGADQNLNYSSDSKVPGNTNHVDATDMTLKVSQGQTITMNFKAPDMSDGMKYCFGGGWMDFNASGTFDYPEAMPGSSKLDAENYDPMGERIFREGNFRDPFPAFQSPEGYSFDFTIPEDATPGQSRLRIVFSDAWFGGSFVPVGKFNKGYSIDFNVEISGTNPGRVAKDTRDEGEAEEPILLEGGNVNGISNATVNNGASTLNYDNGVINFNNVEEATVYTVDGKFVKYVKNNPASLSTAGFAPGVYLVKMQSNHVIRSQKVVIK